jgi:hypothetical protein
MKTAPLLLLMAGLVALGLTVYHLGFRDDLRPPTEPPEGMAGMLGHDEQDSAPSLSGVSPASLDERLRRIEERIGAQEIEVARLRAALPRPGVVDPNALRDILPPGEGEYDEKALNALEAHLKEIERRRRASAQVVLVERNIDRLDLRMNEDERTALVNEVISFRAKTTTFWKDMADRGITDRAEQMAELQKLRDEAIKAIRTVVPEQDVDKAVQGLIGVGAASIHPEDTSGPVRPGR